MGYASVDSRSPLGPPPNGASNTTAFIVGPGYTSELFGSGGRYYYVLFDPRDVGGALGGELRRWPGRVFFLVGGARSEGALLRAGARAPT